MSGFKLENKKTFGNIEAKLYSCTEKKSELHSYITNKVQRPTSKLADLLDRYSGEKLDKKKLLEQHAKLSTPQDHKVPAFDIKRSTVTEFMAEFLLEKEFQCIFFEQTNKKINKSMVDVNRHSTGIDVLGIQEKEGNLKFVVAEVKASQDTSIPCASAKSLKEDIKKALEFEKNRLYSEIFSILIP